MRSVRAVRRCAIGLSRTGCRRATPRHRRDEVRVRFERLEAAAGREIPCSDRLVVRGGDEKLAGRVEDESADPVVVWVRNEVSAGVEAGRESNARPTSVFRHWPLTASQILIVLSREPVAANKPTALASTDRPLGTYAGRVRFAAPSWTLERTHSDACQFPNCWVRRHRREDCRLDDMLVPSQLCLRVALGEVPYPRSLQVQSVSFARLLHREKLGTWSTEQLMSC